MKKFGCIFLFVALLVGCSADKKSWTSEPTRWLGPSADGHYPDTGLLKTWPEEGPEILWTFDSLGIGFSSAVIQNGFLYTTGMIDSTGYLFKLDLDGTLIYRVPYGPEWNRSYPGTRGSPTVVGDKIYLVSGMGKVICFNMEDGSLLWSKEMFKDFDGENIRWGISEAPVVDGEKVYVTPGGEENNVVALNRHSGEVVWSCAGKGDLSAYCTPLLFEHNKRKLLVTYSAASLLGIDPGSGELLWTVEVPWRWSVHAITPLYHEGKILFPSGSNVGGGMLQLSEDGSSVEVLWKNSVSDYKYAAILIDGYVYESYSDNKELSWRCIEWETGNEAWNSKELEFGKAICADGMLYLYCGKGELALVRPDPERLEIVSQIEVTHGSGLHLAVPVMHDGVLYIRHGESMIAYNVRQGTTPRELSR